MATGQGSGGGRNIRVITSGSGHYDEDYVCKKLERANQKVAAAMLKVNSMHKQMSYADSSSDSSDDDRGETSRPEGSSKKPDGAAVHIKKRLGNNSTANITIESSKNIQLGDHNVMVINKGVRKPPREQKMEVDIPSIQDAPPDELTALQQAVLNSEELVDDKRLNVLATLIGKQWRRIFRKLEMNEEEIDQLHLDFNEQGIQTVIYRGLQKWKQKNGRNATTGKLVKVLYDVTKNKEVINSMNS